VQYKPLASLAIDESLRGRLGGLRRRARFSRLSVRKKKKKVKNKKKEIKWNLRWMGLPTSSPWLFFLK
jgi:hypothetical protein